MPGTVALEWAFAQDPKKTVTIICHVLPNCIYDLILCNEFLTATQTLSTYRHRFTRCSFPTSNSFTQFCFLGETGQRLQGTLADAHDVFAVPDTGAERNVMDMDYALEKGLKIERSDDKQYLRFADGTCQETEGRVDTHWTFAFGERIPITFDVLKNCSADVVIGEEFLLENNIFEDHTSSVVDTPYESDFHQLAPFDFVRAWQRPFEKLSGILSWKRRPSDIQGSSDESADYQSPPISGGIPAEEQRRRDMWNYRYNFGATATTVERALERQRREHYASRSTEAGNHHQGINGPGQRRGTGASDRRQLPVIPSIATAPSRR